VNFSSSLRGGRGRAVFSLCVLLLVGGCHSGDSSRQTGKLSDFRVGNIYQLKVDAYLLARTGLVMTVEEAQQRAPAEAEALLEAGTYFKVRQIVAAKDRTTGPRTEIYAEVISGAKKGRVVNLRTVSLEDNVSGATRRNRAVLEPFFTGR
jgi:hypothetical protein